jgi:pyroglutamyl-peptidase
LDSTGSCRVLLLGYSHFAGYTHNPSEEVAERLDGELVRGCRVKGLSIPVSTRYVLEEVPRILESVDPTLALGLGLNPRASLVVLEAASANILHYRSPDEEGVRRDAELIDPEGPRVLAPTIDVARAYRGCKNRGLPVTIGVSIGTYLCNALAYTIERWASQRRRLGGFLHLPPHTTLALRLGLSNYQSLDLIVESVKCVVEESLKALPR